MLFLNSLKILSVSTVILSKKRYEQKHHVRLEGGLNKLNNHCNALTDPNTHRTQGIRATRLF